MKLGIDLYRDMLKKEYYQFARKAGSEAVVLHLVNYHGDMYDDGLPLSYREKIWCVKE
ncbi:hypothetical protein [Priestia megaterium]|uniref:hypothetical protein n=1 Tax=Priestia megaterium TaxID=1404 RepID=UPI00366FF415